MYICDKKVSPIGLGTWRMGGGYWQPDYSNDSLYINAIRYAIDSGLTLIDTAEMYGGGHTEELVGKAIQGYDREELFIITKVWNNHLHYDDVIKSAKASLSRLNSKYIDLYLIHWPNPSVPIKETISAMEKLIDDGIVRCIGVSNFNVNELEEAMYSVKKYEITANEIEYSVLNKNAENDVIPYCEKNNIKVIAYTPLGKGRVSEIPLLKEIGEKYGKTPVQIALAYVMRRAIPIPKAVKKEHIDEIVGALNLVLTDEDYERIRRM